MVPSAAPCLQDEVPAMLRRLAVVIPVFVAAAASVAFAADSVLGDAVITFEIRLPDAVGFKVPGTTLERDRYFNRASCLCSKNTSRLFAAHLTFTGDPPAGLNETVQIFTGAGCDDPQLRPMQCGPRDSEGNVDSEKVPTESVDSGIDVVLAVDELIDPDGDGGCPEEEAEGTIWAIIDANNDNDIEDKPTTTVAFDTKPPPLPPSFTVAVGGEAAIQLAWRVPTANVADIEYWQVLCAHQDVAGNARPAFDAPTHEARYQRTDDADLCDTPESLLEIETLAVQPTDEAVPDPPDASLLAPLKAFDPAYICGEVNGDASGIRIEGLENNEPYQFVLVGVDRVGNYAGATIEGTVTPVPAVDFWEDLHGDGSDVEGGLCLVTAVYGEGGGPGGAITSALRGFRDQTLASSAAGRWLTAAYYDHVAPLGALAQGSIAARVVFAIVLLPLVALALAWQLLTLPGLLLAVALAVAWRRSRRRGKSAPWLRPALGALAALLVLAPATAHAQASFDPYWEDDVDFDEHSPTDVQWHAGVKLGPYVPAIDAQSGGDAYEEMFGGYAILPVFELDRILVHVRGGQLGVGGSVGFFGKSAHPFLEVDPTPRDDVRDRSEGDETKFRMVPMAAHVVYRLTLLDDEWGIPVVPYLRGGLAYYLWWVRAPSGKLARVYEDADGMSCDPADPDASDCTANRALGGSLGVQGSIGLAVRAEQIDPSSAGSMRSSGIYHAGFYAELQLAKVDGFGSDTKLSLGDTTWFAGIDFEF